MVQTGTAREAERTTRSIPHTNPGSERQSRDLTTGDNFGAGERFPSSLSLLRAQFVEIVKKCAIDVLYAKTSITLPFQLDDEREFGEKTLFSGRHFGPA
ncbi:hypothetical protein OUZ56_013311 [Daphnia magna]|uniref:Uncharacterized protein n=1 Tax=Daphnia magna TaxID=35525 RepID=A0ABQ9Z5I8_9CRUS|nr:hypothetical protein OUZ56_013311 [Daphnia magna]